MKTWLAMTLLAAGAVNAGNAPMSTPGQTAVTYYMLCRELPINLAKINAMRSAAAVAADAKLPANVLAARAGVLSAVGGNGTLATVQVLSEKTTGNRSTVAVILSYYNKLPPRQLAINLVWEDGRWKVAD